MQRPRATLIRSGTSKAWLFEAAEIEQTARSSGRCVDAILTAAFGSVDLRQNDGIGGATATTSKAVIVCRGTGHGADVDYDFAQVGIREERAA